MNQKTTNLSDWCLQLYATNLLMENITMIRLLLSIFIISISFNVSANSNSNNNVTDLANNAIQKWEHKVFEGETSYSILQHKGQRALKAVSNSTASGLLLKKKIDLQKTPFLNWRWLTEQQLPALNERSKGGDDFVARVYVVIDGGFAVWKSKSVSYVWSSNQARDQVWNNAFAGSKVKMISVRGKDDKIGQWYNEKRNVYQDLIKQFGDQGSESANLEAYRYIDVIAIMTDTDNSKSKTESYYGDVIFSAK